MTDIAKALRRAYQLGQTYWQQADSDSHKQQAKSDATSQEFEALVATTVAALPQPYTVPDPAEMYKRGFRQFDCPLCGFDGAVGFDPKAIEKACLRCNTPKKCAIHGCSPNTWEAENKGGSMIIGYNHQCSAYGHKYRQWVFFGPRPTCPVCKERVEEAKRKLQQAIDRATPPAKGSPFYIDRDNRDRRKQLDATSQSSVVEPYPILTDRYSFSPPTSEASVSNFISGGDVGSSCSSSDSSSSSSSCSSD